MKLDEALKKRAQIVRAAETQADEDAVKAKWMYNEWANDTDYTAEKDRVRDEDYLYKCRQSHRSQIGWEPRFAPSLWERIPEEGEGTHDNPIPYDASIGMALVEGLFYTEDSVLYECFRSTGTAVYNRLADLVGIYVRVSNGGAA